MLPLISVKYTRIEDKEQACVGRETSVEWGIWLSEYGFNSR